MQGTKDYDKLCTEEFQDCADCGALLVNPSCFPAFGVPYGAVTYHVSSVISLILYSILQLNMHYYRLWFSYTWNLKKFQANLYARNSESRCTACINRGVAPPKSFLTLWNMWRKQWSHEHRKYHYPIPQLNFFMPDLWMLMVFCACK